ncbi:MAG: hypothetical protein ACRCUS_10105 [Anaerovoracaceae bacterium]
MNHVISFTTNKGTKYLQLPVDPTTSNKFIHYMHLCGSCESVRYERTALHVELLDLLHNQPTLFTEIPTGTNVVGLPTITIVDYSIT